MVKPIAPSSKYLTGRYGIDADTWQAMLSEQGGKCVICEKRLTRSRKPVVDHNHTTGEVRGLLCSPCNYTIGALHENTKWLRNALNYIERNGDVIGTRW